MRSARARRLTFQATAVLGLNTASWYAGATQGAAVALFGGSWDWTEFLVQFLLGSLFPAGWTVGERLARRWGTVHPERRRRDAELDLTGKALWTGQLEPGADPAVWGPALESVRKELRTVLCVLGVSAAAALSLVVGSAVRASPADARIWGAAAGIVVVAIPIVAVGTRLVRTRRRLSTKLVARQPGPTPSPS